MSLQKDQSEQEIVKRLGMKFVSSLGGWLCWEPVTEENFKDLLSFGIEKVDRKPGVPILFKRTKSKDEQ